MTDANGQRFWLLADKQAWTAMAVGSGEPPPTFDPERRTHSLGSYAPVRFTETPDDAAARRSLPRMATDAHGAFAFVDAGSGEVHASGSAPSSVVIRTPLAPPTDMAVAGDGVLHVLEADEVVLVDLRDRWEVVRLSQPGFTPARVAAAGPDVVWVLDSVERRLARVVGKPLPRRGLRTRSPDVFDPLEENPTPPRIVVHTLQFDANEDPVDIAGTRDGRLAVLLWRGPSEALIRFVDPEGRVSAAHLLGEVARPYALGFVDDDTLAVLVASLHRPTPDGPEVPGGSEVVTYLAEVSESDVTRAPLGEIYPVPNHDLAPFVRGVGEPLRYAVLPGTDGRVLPPRKLTRVPAHFRATSGELRLDDTEPLDGGRVGFTWHRAYLEARLPPSCGVRMLVAASDERTPPSEFFEHVFGHIKGPPGRPRAVWSSQASEIPFHAGLLECELEPERSGLFSVLLQRSGRRVTALSGRYLWIRLQLEGDGRSTPEIAALRVYGSRFSYAQRYLPRIYHEQLLPPESDAPVSATQGLSPADFLERFLCNFEGVLTPLEDRIANAHLLTDPTTIPEESLDWLASWVGVVFDSAYPTEHRREALRNAMRLNRLRGTVRGLHMAIDILTGGRVEDESMVGGAVTTGKVVILEGWRMRRTFATLLGVDLNAEDDPLLVGMTRSGNSRVGESLILSQEHRYEFLALLRRVLPSGPPEGATVAEWISWYREELVDRFVVEPFLDELAYRLVILVHEDLDRDLVGLIERVAALEVPTHLETDVQLASHPFMVGLASLVGVDSYLRPQQSRPNILVDESKLGTQGFLQRPATLDPRLEGGRS